MTIAHLAVGALAFCVCCTLALGLLLWWSEQGHAQPEEHTVCVSAIGPVDANGNGDTTPDLVCTP